MWAGRGMHPAPKYQKPSFLRTMWFWSEQTPEMCSCELAGADTQPTDDSQHKMHTSNQLLTSRGPTEVLMWAGRGKHPAPKATCWLEVKCSVRGK